jgi:hypothetical protein
MPNNTAPSGLQSKFQSVQELDNEFLRLFPHRYDYIWAVHPNPGAKPDWQTETRHPLADRTIQQGSQLYGVRFGTETSYALIVSLTEEVELRKSVPPEVADDRSSGLAAGISEMR